MLFADWGCLGVVEFLACAKSHRDENVYLDLPKMKASPSMSEHTLMFSLVN